MSNKRRRLIMSVLGIGLFCSVVAQEGELKKVYYANGNLRYEGYFVGKQPVGKVTRYYPDGSVQAVLEYKGEITEAVLYSKDGLFTTVGQYLNKKKNGEWVYRKNDRVVLKECYLNDTLNGSHSRYYASGTLAEIRNWRSGVPAGEWKKFYENGKLCFSAFFKDGKLDSLLKSYAADGTLIAEGDYKNGLKEGVWHYYDARGNLKKEVSYRQGISANVKEEEEEENNSLKAIENESRKIADPARFINEPDVYLRMSE